MTLYQWVTQPFLNGSLVDAGGHAARGFLEEVYSLVHARGVEATPSVHLRVADIWVQTLIIREMEQAVLNEGAVKPLEGKPDKPPLHAVLEPLAKWQERRRRALKDLDDCLGRTKATAAVGFVDDVRPLIEQAERILGGELCYSDPSLKGLPGGPLPGTGTWLRDAMTDGDDGDDDDDDEDEE